MKFRAWSEWSFFHHAEACAWAAIRSDEWRCVPARALTSGYRDAAPILKLPGAGTAILPDLFVFRAENAWWVEVKWQEANDPFIRIQDRHARHYERHERVTGWPAYILILRKPDRDVRAIAAAHVPLASHDLVTESSGAICHRVYANKTHPVASLERVTSAWTSLAAKLASRELDERALMDEIRSDEMAARDILKGRLRRIEDALNARRSTGTT